MLLLLLVLVLMRSLLLASYLWRPASPCYAYNGAPDASRLPNGPPH